MRHKRTTPRTCEQCGKDFLTTAYAVKIGRGRFCSRSCWARFRQWKGGRYISRGYVMLTLPDGRERVPEHRFVMEQVIGRPLRSDETVHHRNRDRADNRPDNLEILPRSEHGRIHGHESKPQGWSKNHPCCVSCGTTERKHNARGLCNMCYLREWKS